ncbi:unnamed protein product [Protopolystoma xenopodis]|uniref:Serine-threonine/tyrosine-protein kinase catalytic domain-containing protein n=1 Tax=Protopolystoma xenopodis TaxID=117903 RepID=A0A3S5B2J0_9PLAT|nr:unnamed protein product [Protopolystoma xenopodis]
MNNRQVVQEIERDYRMPNPGTVSRPCPDDLYNIMLKCWDARPSQRPTFRSLHEIFENWSTHVEGQYLDN